jgi:transcription initiation factor IIE alpha subunit
MYSAEKKGRLEGEKSGEKRGEALKCIKIIQKMYTKSTSSEIAEILDISEEVVGNIIVALTENPQIDMHELTKII